MVDTGVLSAFVCEERAAQPFVESQEGGQRGAHMNATEAVLAFLIRDLL